MSTLVEKLEALAPCPFCGHERIRIVEVTFKYERSIRLRAKCDFCEAFGPWEKWVNVGGRPKAEQEAIQSWNRRAILADHTKEGEGARTELVTRIRERLKVYGDAHVDGTFLDDMREAADAIETLTRPAPAAPDALRDRVSALVGGWKMALAANAMEAKRRGLSMRSMILALEQALGRPAETQHSPEEERKLRQLADRAVSEEEKAILPAHAETQGVLCGACDGSGHRIDEAGPYECTLCHGTGKEPAETQGGTK